MILKAFPIILRTMISETLKPGTGKEIYCIMITTCMSLTIFIVFESVYNKSIVFSTYTEHQHITCKHDLL